MSDDSHGDHNERNGHDTVGGHTHGHDKKWGDYNAEPPAPSGLPPIGPIALLVFGLALLTLIGSIAFNSLEIGSAKPGHASHDTHGSADQH